MRSLRLRLQERGKATGRRWSGGQDSRENEVSCSAARHLSVTLSVGDRSLVVLQKNGGRRSGRVRRSEEGVDYLFVASGTVRGFMLLVGEEASTEVRQRACHRQRHP